MGTRSSGLRIRLLFRVLKRRREDGKSHSRSDRERSKGNPGHMALPFRGSPSTHSVPIWFREESFICGQVRIEASEPKHLASCPLVPDLHNCVAISTNGLTCVNEMSHNRKVSSTVRVVEAALEEEQRHPRGTPATSAAE
jgi:hypothetical protein